MLRNKPRSLCGQPYQRRRLALKWVYPLSEQIRRNFEEDATEKLAESMARVGQIAPILVNHVGIGKYVIIAGERRWRASHLAGLETIEAYVFDNLGAMDFFTLQAHENFHEPIPARDEARAIKRQWDDSHVLGFAFTVSEFARNVRMSETKVRDALRFAENLDVRIQEIIDEGRMPYKVGVRLAAIDDPNEQLRLAVEIMTRKDGFRDAEDIIRKYRAEAKESRLFEMTVEEWQGNMRELVSTGIRWAAKVGLAYLERVLYLIDKGLLPKSILWGTEMSLVQRWISVGRQIQRRSLSRKD